MARAARNTDTDLEGLKRHLSEKAERYSFYQAIRLLRLFDSHGEPASGESSSSSLWERIRIRPFLGLSFPQSDIADIAWEEGDQKALVDVHFFGLYGPSSPLPTFYTEDLIDLSNNDIHEVRGFLDIIHGVLYPLLYEAWEKNKLSIRAYEKGETGSFDRLHVFTGLFDPAFREGNPLTLSTLRYAGLLTQSPRSAKTLEIILSDVLGGVPVTILQCVLKRVPIPEDQRMLLGQSLALGQETVLGEEIEDRMGQIRITAGPVSNEAFERLLPGNEDYRKVDFWFRFTLIDPVLADIDLILDDRDPTPVTLGQHRRGRLGLDTWLETAPFSSPKRVRFPLRPVPEVPVLDLSDSPLTNPLEIPA